MFLVTDFLMEKDEDFEMVDSNTLVKYDNDIFGAFEVTRVISNTQNGIIYESKRRANDCQLVIKQVSKKSVRNYYVIHGQPCPAEFVYHFTASAKNNQYIIRPHEWIEGKNNFLFICFIFCFVYFCQQICVCFTGRLFEIAC